MDRERRKASGKSLDKDPYDRREEKVTKKAFKSVEKSVKPKSNLKKDMKKSMKGKC